MMTQANRYGYHTIASLDGSRQMLLEDHLTGQVISIHDTQDTPIDMLMEIAKKRDWDHLEEAVDNYVHSRKHLAANFKKMALSEDGNIVINGVSAPAEFSDYLASVGSSTDLAALGQFFTRLGANPSISAKADLFRWILANPSISITSDGYIVGYRGLNVNMHSVFSGYGEILRPGAETKEYVAQSHLDNNVGNIVSMPRVMVDHNPDHECSFGLHIGTWDYASSWGDKDTTTICLLDPADVVVVPNRDANKMRVCRYKVVELIKEAVPNDRFVYDTKEVF